MNSLVLQAAQIACLLSFAAVAAAQEPGQATPQPQEPQNPIPRQEPKTLEERIADLERQLRQERMGVVPQEASVRASWVSVDTAGVPELQDTTPRAPSVQSTVDLRLWGRVNFAASYDNFQGSGGIGGADFQNYLTAEGNEELNFNPRDTRFGFAASNTWDDWTGRAVVELDFYGDTASSNLSPRLRLGYVELVNSNGFSLRAGQDWTPIAQQNPGTIDYGILSWAGNAFNRVPQITARCKQGDIEWTLGAMHFRTQNLQDQQERMPWVMARLAWMGLADKKGLLAIGGGYREADVANAAGTVTGEVNNFIIAAEARVPLCPEFAVTAEVWTGKGVGREFLRNNLDYNASGDAIKATGGFVNLEWKAGDQWMFNVGCGVDQPDDSDTDATTLYGVATPFDMNRVLYGNVRYQLSKQAGIGFEFMDFETETLAAVADDGTLLRGQRYTIGTWFIF